MAIEGYVDRFTDTFVAGWAWDSDEPTRHVDVDILVDGELAARVCAGQYRDDLRKNNIGDGNHAFSYSFPSPIDPERHAISAHVQGGIVLPLSAGAHVRFTPVARPLDWPPIKVDTEANAEQLNELYDRVGSVWSQLGQSEPYWSVITVPEFRTDVLSRDDLIFYESGRANVEEFAAFAARSGFIFSPSQTCFELGCGVGRLTAWLAPKFKQVIAADISQHHLDIAAAALRARNIDNVSFRHLTDVQQLAQIGSFDVFFSLMVLQHNPPPVTMSILEAIFAQLNRGGVGYFQLPTYEKEYVFNVNAYLADKSDGMEMHVVPQSVVIDAIYGCGCRLVELREDGFTGSPTGVSNTFLIQKIA